MLIGLDADPTVCAMLSVYAPTPPVVPAASAVTTASGDVDTPSPEITERARMAPEATAVTVSVFSKM